MRNLKLHFSKKNFEIQKKYLKLNFFFQKKFQNFIFLEKYFLIFEKFEIAFFQKNFEIQKKSKLHFSSKIFPNFWEIWNCIFPKKFLKFKKNIWNSIFFNLEEIPKKFPTKGGGTWNAICHWLTPLQTVNFEQENCHISGTTGLIGLKFST